MMGAFRKRRKATAPRTARKRPATAAKACQAARMVSTKFAISSVRRSRSLAQARSVLMESERALDLLFGACSCRRTGVHVAGICARERAGASTCAHAPLVAAAPR